MKPNRTMHRGRRGAAAVELAILLPFLALLCVGSLDFARLFHAYSTITTCARNGALYASDATTAADSPYPNYATAAIADGSTLNPALTTSEVSIASGTDAYGSYVEVTVKYPFTFVSGLFGASSSKTLARTVRMRVLPT